MFSDYIRLIKGFILVIGPKEAGKTSILRRLITDQFEPTQPTLGFLEEYIAKVRTIEIGGHKNYQEYWKTALHQDPDHIFYVIDITNDLEFQEFSKFKYDAGADIKMRNKITLLANKVDLIGKAPTNISNEDLVIICSAKNGTAMMDILEEIIKYKTDKDYNLDNNNSQKEIVRDGKDVEEKVKKILNEFKGKF